MTKKELLTTYRATVIELEELRYQIDRVGNDGRPSGCRTRALCGYVSGTNDSSAAAIQLADGLEAIARKKEDELLIMKEKIDVLLNSIKDFRTYMVIQHYYILAKTDEQVAMAMAVSRGRVNQIRREFLASS